MSVEAPTTYLDLVQRARLECGESGSGPVSVVGNSGIEQLLVAWTREAWLHIQRLNHDWHFLRKSTTFTTTDGKFIYTPTEAGVPANTFAFWKRDTVRNYDTAAGVVSEIFMSFLSFDDWRDSYLFGGTRNVRTRPTVFAIHPPDHGLALGPVPSNGYTVTADYFIKPVSLTLDTDVPGLPDQYIMAIVYRTMMEYGMYYNAMEVYQRGSQNYKEALRELGDARMPDVFFSGSIV